MRATPILMALALAGCDQGTAATPTRTETALKEHEGKTVYTAADPNSGWHAKQDCPELVRVRKVAKVGPCTTHVGGNLPCLETCPGRHKEYVMETVISATVKKGRPVDEKQAHLERNFCVACEK